MAQEVGSRRYRVVRAGQDHDVGMRQDQVLMLCDESFEQFIGKFFGISILPELKPAVFGLAEWAIVLIGNFMQAVGVVH